MPENLRHTAMRLKDQDKAARMMNCVKGNSRSFVLPVLRACRGQQCLTRTGQSLSGKSMCQLLHMTW